MLTVPLLIVYYGLLFIGVPQATLDVVPGWLIPLLAITAAFIHISVWAWQDWKLGRI